MTATAGLGPILDLFIQGPLFSEFCQCLPPRVSNNSYDTEAFALVLLAGFLVGFDCLDDLEHFQNNPLIVERFGLIPTAKAFGDWLRDFEPEDISRLKEFLKHHAQSSRKQINTAAPLIVDMDSTHHVQHGLKMATIRPGRSRIIPFGIKSLKTKYRKGEPMKISGLCYWMETIRDLNLRPNRRAGIVPKMIRQADSIYHNEYATT